MNVWWGWVVIVVVVIIINGGDNFCWPWHRGKRWRSVFQYTHRRNFWLKGTQEYHKTYLRYWYHLFHQPPICPPLKQPGLFLDMAKLRRQDCLWCWKLLAAHDSLCAILLLGLISVMVHKCVWSGTFFHDFWKLTISNIKLCWTPFWHCPSSGTGYVNSLSYGTGQISSPNWHRANSGRPAPAVGAQFQQWTTSSGTSCLTLILSVILILGLALGKKFVQFHNWEILRVQFWNWVGARTGSYIIYIYNYISGENIPISTCWTSKHYVTFCS